MKAMGVRTARACLHGLLLQAVAAASIPDGSADREAASAADVGSDDSSLVAKSISSVFSVKDVLHAGQEQGWKRMCSQANPGASDNDDECDAATVCKSEHHKPLSVLDDWRLPPAYGAASGKTCRVECHRDKSGCCFFGNSTQCRGGQCGQICVRAPPRSGMCITGWCLKGNGCKANNCVSNMCYSEATPVCFSPADFGCHSPINCFVIHWKWCSDCQPTPYPTPRPTPKPRPTPRPRPTPKPKPDDDDDDDKDDDDDDKDKKDDDDDDKDKKDDDDKDKKDDDDKDKKDDDDKDKKDDDDKDKKDDDDKDKKDDKDSRRRRASRRRRHASRRRRNSRRRHRDTHRRRTSPYGSSGSYWRGWNPDYYY